MEFGEQAETAGRILDELRGSLRNLEHVELAAESTAKYEKEQQQKHEHELVQFNDSVSDLETLIERYRDSELV